MKQSRDPDLAPSTNDADNETASWPSTNKKRTYVPPVIPMGPPHVVQYVTGSLLHMPGPFQLMADRMSRYANAYGEVSIALEFLCKISDLGSKNTAKGYIDKLTAMDMLETVHGQGGNDRKSNTYRFLGAKRNWRPLPGEEPGSDPWLILLEVRLENEDLKQQVQDLTARIDRMTNGGAVGHPEVTNGEGAEGPDSYETAAHQGDSGAIGHSKVTNGGASQAPQTASHSYETFGSGVSPDGDEAIGPSEVTNGDNPAASESITHRYENPDPHKPPGENTSISHSEETHGLTEGQDYLARRARVEPLVMDFRDHYHQSFRGGIPAAVHYFSESAQREEELQVQLATLRADREAAGHDPPPEADEPIPSGRRGVEPCPDCDGPFTTHGGAEYCPECTGRRRRGGD